MQREVDRVAVGRPRTSRCVILWQPCTRGRDVGIVDGRQMTSPPFYGVLVRTRDWYFTVGFG